MARVYDRPGPDDGARVLVDRLWPRGLAKKAADPGYRRAAGGIPAHGDQRAAWDAGSRFGFADPECR